MSDAPTLKRNILSGTFRSELQLSLPIQADSLPLIADSITKEILPSAFYSQGEARDWKGADSERWQVSSQTGSRELLFFARGEFYEQGAMTGQRAPQHFEIRANTAFDRFEGSHHIIHRVRLDDLGGLSDHLPIEIAARHLGRIIPVRLHQLLLGMEFFQSKRYMLFGYAPVVTEYFTLSVTSEKLDLSICAESLPTKDTLPLSRTGYFEKLQKLILKACAVNLEEYYKKR